MRQRHTPSLSLRISRRCVAPSSRLSKMRSRCAADWRRSLLGSFPDVMRNGMISR
ncbi:Uncharacterised protein [Mycobacteroides abscessus]|nr:Uncharacterised protein [Mycobacteroides abscessus]